MTRDLFLAAALMGMTAIPLSVQAQAPATDDASVASTPSAPSAMDSQVATPASATSSAEPQDAPLIDGVRPTVVRAELVTNGPIPDTPANRARFGGPNSHGGRRTAASGD